MLCLINYGKPKAEKTVRNKWFVLDYQGSNQLTDKFCYHSKQKMCTWTDEDNKNIPERSLPVTINERKKY
jgi:hypothetical protein